MRPHPITDGISWVGAVDWDRRVFDELVPVPEGTTYNSYLVRGTDKTVLIDAVDPAFERVLFDRLATAGVERLDHVVVNHAEQDHSGALPALLARFPEATVLATSKAKGLLVEHLGVPAERLQAVEDGGRLALGGKTLRFVHFPWVHWPETMITFVEEDRVLFPGDLFGSHLAFGTPLDADPAATLVEAKRYYGEIMMPFRKVIARNLPKIEQLDPLLVAPSHGPVHRQPAGILDAYRSWLADTPRNAAVVAYASMHDSTRSMVRHLGEELGLRGVRVELFGLVHVDLGKLATALVDAATIVFGSPTVLGGAHPLVASAALVTNLLKPKARFLAVVGSYGWGGKMKDQLVGLLPDLELELVGSVLTRGTAKPDDLAALDLLAATVAERHAGLRLT